MQMHRCFTFYTLDSSSARFFNRAAPISESFNSILTTSGILKKLEKWLGLTKQGTNLEPLALHETTFTSDTAYSSNPQYIHEEEKISSLQPVPSHIKQPSSLDHEISNVPIPAESVKEDQFLSIFRSEGDILPMSREVEENTRDLDYLVGLEKDVDSWTLKTERPFARVYLRNSSDYNAELPMVMTLFNMECDAEPEHLFEIMYEPAKRKKWDKQSVIEFVELEKPHDDVLIYYMANKAPWPFTDRDFVDKRWIRYRSNGDIEILTRHTTYENLPEISKKCERGKTIIAGQIIRKRIDPSTSKPTLLITMINQSDMGGKIPAKALSETLPASLLKWCKNMQTVLNKYVKTGEV